MLQPFKPLGMFVVVVLSSSCALAQPRPAATQPASQPAVAGRVVAVTVYRGSALVTREVEVAAGAAGSVEVVVSSLPDQTVDSSLYTDGSDGLRVLSTRYRSRAVRQDTRKEVRAKEDEVRALGLDAAKLQRESQVIDQNLQLLAKLENFTAATMQQLAEKGLLNGQTTIDLSKYVMDSRGAFSTRSVDVQQKLQANAEAQQFAQRQLSELSAGSSREERDAVITVDKTAAAAGTVRLNYLVNAATWEPRYKFRAGGGEQDPVQVEYLAAVQQQSGEDWGDASVTLSTAAPMLNAAPPDLLALDVSVAPVGTSVVSGTLNSASAPAPNGQAFDAAANGGFGGAGGGGGFGNYTKAKALRLEAQGLLNGRGGGQQAGIAGYNNAAALEQADELLSKDGVVVVPAGEREGPSVAYHLGRKYGVPSRNDEQLIEIARLELKPEFFYKAVPVLSPHVYRLAELTNSSDQVLLAGEATMYLGADFVGRTNLPLVAVGERFVAGFGVDPQIQAERTLVSKANSVQGGNQVHTYDYRVRVSSFKKTAVAVQLWDRMPHAEAEAVGVSLVTSSLKLSDDAGFVRADQPKNLLRWDLKLDPGANHEKAQVVTYQFKLEYDRNLSIAGFRPAK